MYCPKLLQREIIHCKIKNTNVAFVTLHHYLLENLASYWENWTVFCFFADNAKQRNVCFVSSVSFLTYLFIKQLFSHLENWWNWWLYWDYNNMSMRNWAMKRVQQWSRLTGPTPMCVCVFAVALYVFLTVPLCCSRVSPALRVQRDPQVALESLVRG